MTNQEMLAKFKIGDIVERTPEWMKKNPKGKNFKVEVVGFDTENICLKVSGEADAGTIRFPETMRVIERGGIRIGDYVKQGEKLYKVLGFGCNDWLVYETDKGDIGALKPNTYRRATDEEVQEQEIRKEEQRRTLKIEVGNGWQDHELRRMLDDVRKGRTFELSVGYMVGSDERKMEVIDTEPKSGTQAYENLVKALAEYNAIAEEVECAPRFKLVTL